MTDFEISQDFDHSADAVWSVLADFAGVDWMPGVESCEAAGDGVGMVRDIRMGPMSIKEKLVSHDDEARVFSYSIEEGPLPVEDYLATVAVTETGAGRCRVDWTARFRLPEGVPAEGIVQGLQAAYGGSLKALAGRLSG